METTAAPTPAASSFAAVSSASGTSDPDAISTTLRGASAAFSRYAPRADRFSAASVLSCGRFWRESASSDGVFAPFSATSQHSAVSTASAGRSEEHTSELQSLMRISYAVFCLKKKKYTNNTTSDNVSRNTEIRY